MLRLIVYKHGGLQKLPKTVSGALPQSHTWENKSETFQNVHKQDSETFVLLQVPKMTYLTDDKLATMSR